MPRSRFRIVATFVAALLAAPDADAQAPDTTAVARRAPDPLCWRGRPLARCRAFVLFEFSAPRHLLGSRVKPDLVQIGSPRARLEQAIASQFLVDLGYMVNVGEREAVGGTLTVGGATDAPSADVIVGVTGRYRRWLTRRVSADAALGLQRAPVGIVEPNPFPGADNPLRRTSVMRPTLMAEARLGFGDLVAVTGRGMLATDGRGRTHHALLAGASTGSTVTAVGTAASAAWVAFLIVVFAGGTD